MKATAGKQDQQECEAAGAVAGQPTSCCRQACQQPAATRLLPPCGAADGTLHHTALQHMVYAAAAEGAELSPVIFRSGSSAWP